MKPSTEPSSGNGSPSAAEIARGLLAAEFYTDGEGDDEALAGAVERLLGTIAAALGAATERGRMQGWRPIADAPRDGTQILVPSQWAGLDADIAAYDAEGPSGHFWWSVKLELAIDEPTHFQYLPAPPAAIAAIPAPPADRPRECECFGDSGLHGSTYRPAGSDRAHCDLCGRPVPEDSESVLSRVNRAPPAGESERG